MRWQGRQESGNVEDRRGVHPGVIAGGGGTLILALIYMFLGGDPSVVLRNAPPPSASSPAANPQTAEGKQMKEFVSVVLADTENVWQQEFKRRGKTYHDPKLVLFTGRVESACGSASAAAGPFYCGEDEKVYIDLSFYQELKQRFGAPGDFAQAYVIAHEVGHHVQDELGVMDKVNAMRERSGEAEANRLSVRLELEADYLAGVWAHYAKQEEQLDEKDISDAVRAATAIGDDTLQKESQGYVVPDSFTHGTSEQRVQAFTSGWQSGDLERGIQTYTPGL